MFYNREGAKHSSGTSEKSAGQETEIASNQEPTHLPLPVLTCTGTRPAVFRPLFLSHPPYCLRLYQM